jgi:phenylalanyl-tRNA synthetase beta chain
LEKGLKMKVSKSWLQELVNLKVSIEELERLIPLRTIATKEVTKDFIELDMKGYNRADLLSLRGVAYEVGAITDSPVKFSEPEDSEYVWVEQTLPALEVKVENTQLCSLYCLAKIEGLKVDNSPANWIKKLTDSGMRSINNLTDITNLIMLEYGQPLHGFDAEKINGEVAVRLAKTGERIKTIDHKDRELMPTDLVITDNRGPIAIAGVMGGAESEVSDSTSTILLEAAIFDPLTVRTTAGRLNLASEASKRFQHGLTSKRLLQALNQAIKMYQDLGGRLVSLEICGETQDQLIKIPLRLEKTNSLVGIKLTIDKVGEYLKELHFDQHPLDTENWVVTPPYWRLDCEIEEDLIEEIARMYGYEKIPAKELPGEPPAPIDQELFELIHKLKAALVEKGLTEVQTYSFYSTNILKVLGFDEKNKILSDKNILVKLKNPMSQETEYLRFNIWGSLIEVAEKNLKQGIEDIAIFEVGKTFMQVENQPPKEMYALGILLTDPEADSINQLYQIAQELFKKMGKDVKIEKAAVPSIVKHLFLPHKFLDLKINGGQIGGMAQVHPRVTDKLGINQKVAVLEIYLEPLL